MLINGHIHTPFCPHGTKDELHQYVEKAITLGFDQITFTEHAPLPKGFIDTTPTRDSSMSLNELGLYFEEVNRVKKIYQKHISVLVGLEVDYIEGFEKEITSFLNQFGNKLDDSILSVHFLKRNGQYECLDYSPQLFEEMIHKYGSVEAIYGNYYRTLLMSIRSDLGVYKPKRIGHMTLIRKFHKKFPTIHKYEAEILEILTTIKNKGYELDYNGAGTAKPLCKEPYPPEWIALKAIELGIPLIYGSDAHQVKELMQGFDELIKI
ncbi:histidinol-phosphatase HisJ [Bacillus sp. 31A1R]|uniref:Histidinol-phosphatase n=1 Tax=Robertmurraya mangrovi TaxID=3098077 RepID=A0ABU5IZI3_9BACI|nr:histidinol-phosphatase HisJ [Bacillus sp. 31A1R]MDZ5472531.1 histidinol-phosphatase HisJ [Bacillus sp. 31A1R]